MRPNPARTGPLLVLPALLLLCALTLYPLAYGIWISFFNKHSFFPEQNFIALQLVLGVGAALLLNEAFTGRGLVRAVAIFPYVIPTVVAVIVWKWLLNSQFGLVNHFLGVPVSWMGR